VELVSDEPAVAADGYELLSDPALSGLDEFYLTDAMGIGAG